MRGTMRKPKTSDEEAYQRLLAAGITKTRLAMILGVSKQAITRWTTVPLRHVRAVSEATGISKKNLRPSDFS
jgi:hypothetical protein